jgi:hypothetical protein
VTAGTASGSPVKPALPVGNTPLCYVYLRVGGTSVKNDDDSTNHYIEEARTMITAPSSVLTDTDSLAE